MKRISEDEALEFNDYMHVVMDGLAVEFQTTDFQGEWFRDDTHLYFLVCTVDGKSRPTFMRFDSDEECFEVLWEKD